MLKHLLSVSGFIVVSFAVQGLNHFVLNKAHYEEITFARAEPVLWLGVLTMVIQGFVLSFALTKVAPNRVTISHGMLVSLAFGLFLASYIAMAEPAKYAAPSIPSWFMTEGIVSTIQFVVFGVVLGLIHKRFS